MAIDPREFKRRLLANIFADAANDGDADVSLYRLFIDIVDAIEPHHITLLERIRARTSEIDEMSKSDKHTEKSMAGAEFDQLVPLIEVEGGDADEGATQRALAAHVLSSLMNHSLVSTRPKGGSRNDGRVAVGTNLNASQIWYMSSYILTPVGKRFCEYLEDDGAAA